MDTFSAFITTHHLTGILIGFCTFLIIGVFHPIVVKSEYHFGVKCWWVFLLLGIVCAAAAIRMHNVFFSSILGVCAFSSFWSILEIFEQRKRVNKGWFPKKQPK